MTEYLFVYGTLLPDTASESMKWLLRRVRRAGEGSVRGRLYDLGNFPALVLDPTGEELVRGELLTVSNRATWMRLDTYEGCDASRPERSLFQRERVNVTRADGSEASAWAYVYNKEIGSILRIESGCWQTHLSSLPEIVIP